MTHSLEGKLEPEARDCQTPEHAAMLSIAVSLKRIADALNGGIFTAPINAYGESIGDAIQGQLVRGMAGIDQHQR